MSLLDSTPQLSPLSSSSSSHRNKQSAAISRQSRSCKVCRLRKVKVCFFLLFYSLSMCCSNECMASAIGSTPAMLVALMDIPPNAPMKLFPAMTPFPKPTRLPIYELRSISSSVV